MITTDRLKDVLFYDQETGIFRWVMTMGNRVAGSIAGSRTFHGYRRIRIDNIPYFSHRLAWFYVHERWPLDEIDHINGNRVDNRIINLREADRSINQHNQRNAHRSPKSSGLLGVTWDARKGKWQAQITLHGKNHFIGRFSSAEIAHAAYVAKKREIHPGNML